MYFKYIIYTMIDNETAVLFVDLLKLNLNLLDIYNS